MWTMMVSNIRLRVIVQQAFTYRHSIREAGSDTSEP